MLHQDWANVSLEELRLVRWQERRFRVALQRNGQHARHNDNGMEKESSLAHHLDREAGMGAERPLGRRGGEHLQSTPDATMLDRFPGTD